MLTRVLFAGMALSATVLLSITTGAAQQQRPDIAATINGLGDKDPSVQWASVVAASKGGAGSVPSLVKALGDTREKVRANAALALGRIGAPAKAAVPNLIAALKDTSSRVRENAAEALGETGQGTQETVDALLLCLGDQNPYVNGKSAEALSKIGGPAVPGLTRTLISGSATARWSAIIALGKIGPAARPGVPAITSALSDTSTEVRWGATVALGNIGGSAESALPALLQALSDRNQEVRRGASHALEQIDPSAAEQRNGWKSVAEIVDTLAPRLMKEEQVPGAAVALISNRTLVWSRHYGVADVNTGKTVTDETMFEACSMTKPVFGFLVMKLVEEGRLDLDRPLVDYLDPSALRGEPMRTRITARMVLSHTSGLPNWRMGEEERDGPIPVLFTPGSIFGYSGEGFTFLQRVVERITGEPLDIHATRTLFRPAGLTGISFAWTEDLDGRIASGHDSGGRFLQKTRYVHPNAAYTLYTSAADYARFLIEIMNPGSSAQPSVVRNLIDTMLTPQVRVTSREPIDRPGTARASGVSWGLGWAINTTPKGNVIHHSGSNRSGFRCFSQFCPATGTGIVIMTNGAGGGDVWVRLISRIGNL